MFPRSANHIKKLFFPTIRSYSRESYTKVVVQNEIANITMCHKPTRNSLSIPMMHELIKNISEHENRVEIRAIVLGAEGPIFSSGHNLKELSPDFGRDQQVAVFNLASKLMYTIIDSPLPIIAKIDGIAAAAGCQLVAQCDLAFCTEKSTFSTPGANFGIFCSTPGIALSRCVPKTTALKMLLTGLPISSLEAEQKGLITKVSTNLDEEILSICEAIKSKSRSVIELGKRFFYKQTNCDIKTAYKLGAEIMVDNLNLNDGQEGIRSFTEKRKPNWKHV